MARIINLSIEVTDAEMENFLHRMSGADGRKVTPQVEATDADDGPVATDAPAVDKNNVAWNATYHSSSKALNADGTWRRRKGMSDAEKAAADAYDKCGDSITATSDLSALPVETVTEGPVSTQPEAPTLPAPTAMPGLPTAAPVAPEPVTYEEVVALFGQAVAKDASVSANFAELYAKAGVTDPQVLTTDAGAEQRIALAGLLRGIIAG